MSIDKSKLPPQLQELLKTLESKGVNVEVIAGEMPPELKAALGFNRQETGPKPTTSEPSSTGSPNGYPPFAEFLDKQADVIASLVVDLTHKASVRLHDHLCPRIKKLEGDIQRQNEINDSLFGELRRQGERLLKAEEENAELRKQLSLTNNHLNDLAERHRVQVGLLHRRVSKRKGEIKETKVRVASTRGRVTKLAKAVA